MTSCPATFCVIPVHNRREITHRCLSHLQAHGVPGWVQIIVVDDGSSDGTGTMIAAEFPWAVVLTGDGTLWWAGAIRLGMRHAISAGARCICWLNDDCLPHASALPLLAATATSRKAVCGAVCHGIDGQPAYGGGFITGGWPSPLLSSPPAAAEIPVEWLHGNLVAIPELVWRRIGLPEASCMRHNLSDIDYTHLAHRHGIPVLLLPQAKGVTEINENLSYRSWASPQTSAWEVLSGLWNPRAWWYAPGLACFLFRLRGWRGGPFLAWILLKCAAAVALKCLLPSRWVSWLQTRRWR